MRKTRQKAEVSIRQPVLKRHKKTSRQAQRKFASNNLPNYLATQFNGGPSNDRLPKNLPEVTDFVDFLCMRGTPDLAARWEHFAQPCAIVDEEFYECKGDDNMDMSTTSEEEINVVSDDEGDYVGCNGGNNTSSEDNASCKSDASIICNGGDNVSCNGGHNVSRTNGKDDISCDGRDCNVVVESMEEGSSQDTDSRESTPLKYTSIKPSYLNDEESNSSSVCSKTTASTAAEMETIKVQNCRHLVQFLNEEKCTAVVLLKSKTLLCDEEYYKNVKSLNVTTTHVHRLKLSKGENAIRHACFKRHLNEHNDQSTTDHPTIGHCEIDLCLLADTVESFGGIEWVTDHWSDMADRLNIPKSSRLRVSKLEDIYLKYLLPYTVLPDEEKARIRAEVLIDRNIEKPTERESMQDIPLVKFEHFSANVQEMYTSADCQPTTVEQVEEAFWKRVTRADRYVAVFSSDINTSQVLDDAVTSVLDIETLMKHRMSDVIQLRPIEYETVPWLRYESYMSTTKWHVSSRSLYTLAYVHAGAALLWYVIPKESKEAFRELQNAKRFPTPDELSKTGLLVKRCVQKAGQLVVIAPDCYHMSVACGYAVSERLCVATSQWFASDAFRFVSLTTDNYGEHLKILVGFLYANFCVRFTEAISSVIFEKLAKFKRLFSNTVKNLKDRGIRQANKSQFERDEILTCKICSQLCYPVYCWETTCKSRDFTCAYHAGPNQVYACLVTLQEVSMFYARFLKRSKRLN